MNPSYFDVNYRGIGFWPIPKSSSDHFNGNNNHMAGIFQPAEVQTLCTAGHDGIYVLGAENGTVQLWQRDASVDQ